MTRSASRARTLSRALPLLGAPALAALVALPAAAQQKAAAACEIDQNKPASLATAVFSITRVQSATDTAVKHKALRDAVAKVAADPNAPKQNAVGTAYTLGQAYAILAQDVTLANRGTRGSIGLPGNAAEPVDLLKLVDSTMTAVATAKPECAEATDGLRQYAWLNTANRSLAMLNEQKLDSAAWYAERSLVVYGKSPLPHYVLGTAAMTKQDYKAAEGHYRRTVALAGSDTTMKDVKAAAEQNIAAARAGQAQALAESGNYAAILADAANLSDLSLTQVGVQASAAKKYDDAAKLFEAALQKNRYQRDAINNLAATQMQLKNWTGMIPTAQRLTEIDPSNPDGYVFIALAYQELGKAEKSPARVKAYTDSLLKYNNIANDLPAKVTFTEFTRGAEKSVLAVTLENLAKKAAPARPAAARPGARPAAAAAPAGGAAPKTFTLQMEFLGLDGNVIDTRTVSVGPVAPGETKTERVEVGKPGVAAFRYKMQG